MKTITRQAYMNKEITHEEFYSYIVDLAGIPKQSDFLLGTCKQALASGDTNLNTIPLAKWDTLAETYKASISRALQSCGDSFTLAGGVCTVKQAVKNQIKKD